MIRNGGKLAEELNYIYAIIVAIILSCDVGKYFDDLVFRKIYFDKRTLFKNADEIL